MINRFILNEVSYFGAGSRKELPEALARLNLHKALVTTDKGLLKVGTAQMVTEVLDKAGFPYEIYSEIKPALDKSLMAFCTPSRPVLEQPSVLTIRIFFSVSSFFNFSPI